MRFQNHFCAIAYVTFGVCILVIFAGYHYIKYYPRHETYVETILEQTRLKNKFETWDYNFTYSEVNKLGDLVIESGGTPVRSLIVSTWRSGSSFLGNLLNAMPSNFYHYEPLIKHKSKQVRKELQVDRAKHIIKNLFMCNYTDMEDYFEFGKNVMKYGYFSFNTRLWDSCKYKTELCTDANFSASLCKLFPFQSMKLVRLRLTYVDSLLDDEELNIKVVMLIRDPRGVMSSRKKLNFCTKPDCTDPELLCTDMISDYMAADKILQKYPDRIMVRRFEDLVLNVNEMTDDIFKFLGLEPNQSIEEFLLAHTKANKTKVYSKFRLPRDAAFKWKTRLDFNDIAKIQEVCEEAMNLWGYQLADNATHLASEEFFPLKPYIL